MNNLSLTIKKAKLPLFLQKKSITIKKLRGLSACFPGESKNLDIDLLLMQGLKCSRAYLYTHGDQILNTSQIKKIKPLLNLRLKGWPMAYILKQKEFYGLKFQVEEGVFIPRPETETLVSAVLSYYSGQTNLNIMDFGCGTG